MGSEGTGCSVAAAIATCLRTSTKLVYLESREVTMRCTSFSILRFSSSSMATYHLDSRVFPCRFCSKKNRIWRVGVGRRGGVGIQ
jgi:hypothetical protein